MAGIIRNRSELMLGCGCAALAIGLALTPDRAQAQAFQATESVVSGSVTRTPTGTGTETIEIASPTAVIDWIPDEISGDALDFLPTGAVATFQDDGSGNDFAVLNRVLPATNGNITVFDGTLVSRISDGLGGFNQGGTVMFYSPTGILVGSNAVFDVGNLILTSLDPDLASFDDFAINGGQLQLGGSPTTAVIQIDPGADFVALSENSFFAVIAAEVQMFGTSAVNGSTAFIAGEAVNITVSNGLFDIQIPTGTTVGTPIVIDGDVGGPSSTGVTGDNHMIYAVAAAQTDPISLLFSGNLGFDPAASAGIVNGEIILSANYEVNGREVANGTLDTFGSDLFDGREELTTAGGRVTIEGITATSSMIAVANEFVRLTADGGDTLVDGDLAIFARNTSEIRVDLNNTLTITGDVLLSASDRAVASITGQGPTPFDTQGGSAFINLLSGTLVINGDVLVSARASSILNGDTGIVGAAQGGFAGIFASGGSVQIDGTTNVAASAFDTTGDNGGDITGGTAQVEASNGGAISFGDTVFVDAGADGTFGTNAFGGQSDFRALSDGSLSVAGDLFVTSTARANFGGAGTLIGASATGGNALLQNSGTGTVSITGNVGVDANALAGSSTDQNGGIGTGGTAEIFLNGDGNLAIGGNVNLSADGSGGISINNLGGDGLGGIARAITISTSDTLTIDGTYSATAQGTGGEGVNGGDGLGGAAGAIAELGSLNIGNDATVNADGTGGNASFGFGGTGGTGTGGLSFLQATGTLTGTAVLSVGGNAFVNSNGTGGNGGVGDGSVVGAGTGGIGIGGQFATQNPADPGFSNGAFILGGADNGNITIAGNSEVNSIGSGGRGGDGGLGQNGGDGGNGTGGTAQLGLSLLGGDGSVGAGSVSVEDVIVLANGNGGEGGNGSGTGAVRGIGGIGTGFDAFLTVRAGSLAMGNLQINSDGFGGAGSLGGDGIGGQTFILGSDGGLANFVDLGSFSNGLPGAGDDINGHGNGFGGTTLVQLDDAQFIVSGDFIATGDALGAAGNEEEINNATGGSAQIDLTGLNTVLTVAGTAQVNAFGRSGETNSATQAGNAAGGTATLSITDGATASFNDDFRIFAGAFGGSNLGSGAGGDAIGGDVDVSIVGSTLNTIGAVRFSNDAFGGFGAIGGSAQVGDISFFADGSTINLQLAANGEGFLGLVGNASGGTGNDQGGDATAGLIDITINETSISGAAFGAIADAQGGNANGTTGIGGNASSGIVSLSAGLSQFDLIGGMLLSAEATGGEGGANGGNAQAGSISANLDQSDLAVASAPLGNADIEIVARARGGVGQQNNGNATGGAARLVMTNSTLDTPDLLIDAQGDGEAIATGSVGGIAVGGAAEFIVDGNSTVDAANAQLISDALSTGAGSAEGGVSTLFIGPNGAPLLTFGTLLFNASGVGSDSDLAGRFFIDVEAGSLLATNLFVDTLGDAANPALLESSLVAEGGDLLISGSLTVLATDDFIVRTGQGSIIGGPDPLAPTATISITTDGLLSIFGDDDNLISFGGASMSLTSSDIVIDSGARIGAFDVQLSSNNTDAPALIGGTSGPINSDPNFGYVLSGVEAERIEVGNFAFIQPVVGSNGPNDPDIVISDVIASGSLDDGVSSIQVSTVGTDGIIRVEGEVIVEDAASTDTASFFANGRIEVVTPGGIGLVDPDGNPTGTIQLSSNNIWVADSDTIADLQAEPTFTGRNEQLSTAAPGSDDPLGYIRADSVSINVGETLLVRNTGTSSEPGGILVGEGGLSIFSGEGGSSSTDGLDVFAYGARLGSNGELITGETFFNEVEFNETGTNATDYSDDAQFNECLIVSSNCDGTGEAGDEVEEVVATVNNPSVVEAAVTSSQPVVVSEAESDEEFGIDFPGLVEADDLEEDGDIDDPVASGGDSSLYGQSTAGSVRVEGN